MRKTSVYLLLILTFLIAIGVALQDFRFDNWSNDEHVASTIRDRDLAAVAVEFAQLREGQVAYLAAGQNPQFWTEHVASLSAQIDGELTRLRGNLRSTEGQKHFDAAGTAFADLLTADKRARSNIENDQMLVASDVILADSLEIVERFQTELATTRNAESAATDVTTSRLSQLRLATTASGMVAIFGLSLVAVLLGRSSQPAVSPAATMAQMLRELPPPVKTPALGTVSASSPAASPVVASPMVSPGTLAAAVPTVVPAPTAALLNLPEAAELCVDLARVADGRDIADLLQRAARLLDANGVIVWVVDAAGVTLQPMLTHGYPDRVLRRLGTLATAADNVTSLSFRSGKPQSMNASDPSGSGALAVPLVSASGCTGVLAAEVRHARPNADALALARIVAAQLATIIGPMDATASKAVNG